MSDAAGHAYLVVPDDGPGHGVLVLHSWWGLTPAVKEVVEALADAGYTALAPDLLDGARPADGNEARDVLAASDPNETAALVLSSIVALRAHSADPDGPVAVVGFSMGASWALWAATRQPDSVDAVVAYYGVQNIDFDALSAPVLGHFAEISLARNRSSPSSLPLMTTSARSLNVSGTSPEYRTAIVTPQLTTSNLYSIC